MIVVHIYCEFLWRERPPHVLGYFQVGDLAGKIASTVLEQEIVSAGPINPLQIDAARGDSKADLWIEYVLAPVIRSTGFMIVSRCAQGLS
jgi:hypothetical protein